MAVSSAPMHIRRTCAIAPLVTFCTTSHDIVGRGNRASTTWARPMRVGDGCCIAARARILPGVTIGEGCVIGAGAAVTKHCAPHGVYVGAPARRMRNLPPAPANASVPPVVPM